MNASPSPHAGGGVVRASLAGTAVFAATAGLATAVAGADLLALLVALALFAAGTVAFGVALVVGAGRSRTELVDLPGLFFLSRAPARPRRLLLGSLAAQVAVAFATAAARPNTSLAFGLLAPMYGQGLAGLWGARHHAFPPRPAPARPGRKRA